MPIEKKETGVQVHASEVYLEDKNEADKRIQKWGNKPYSGHSAYKAYRRVGDLPE